MATGASILSSAGSIVPGGNMKLIEHVLSTQVVYAGKYLSTEQQTVILPDGRQAVRDIVRPPDAVAIVPIGDDGRIYLVRQYRPAIRRAIYEIPAGIIDPGDARLPPPGGSARKRLDFARAGCSNCVPSIPRSASPPGLSGFFWLKASWPVATAATIPPSFCRSMRSHSNRPTSGSYHTRSWMPRASLVFSGPGNGSISHRSTISDSRLDGSLSNTQQCIVRHSRPRNSRIAWLVSSGSSHIGI